MEAKFPGPIAHLPSRAARTRPSVIGRRQNWIFLERQKVPLGMVGALSPHWSQLPVRTLKIHVSPTQEISPTNRSLPQFFALPLTLIPSHALLSCVNILFTDTYCSAATFANDNRFGLVYIHQSCLKGEPEQLADNGEFSCAASLGLLFAAWVCTKWSSGEWWNWLVLNTTTSLYFLLIFSSTWVCIN
jgi:hypothetical protein